MLVTILTILFAIVCLFLMLVILIQKPKGGGLSGAFGGAGGSAQAAFGARTGDVLTWFTVVCFVLFILLAMGLTWTVRPPTEQTSVIQPHDHPHPHPQQTTTQTASPLSTDAEPEPAP